MKRFLLVVAAVAAVSFAKAETEMLLDSIVDFDATGAPSKKEVFLYDASGKANMWYMYGISASGEWSQQQVYQLSYQYSDGRVSLRNEKLSTSSGWILMNRTFYTYDEEGRLTLESRESLSAVGNTWSEIARYLYEYDEWGIYKILYQFGGGEDYLSYILDSEASTETERVFDIYWTGYEEEGTDGQRIYYASEHEVTPVEGIEEVVNANAKANAKWMHEGQLYILRGGQLFSPAGARVR